MRNIGKVENLGREEFVYKCGCRTSKYRKWKPENQTLRSNIKSCPEHNQRIDHKIKWCFICGKEKEISTKHNSAKFLCCDKCREINYRILMAKHNPANNLKAKMKRLYNSGNRKKYEYKYRKIDFGIKIKQPEISKEFLNIISKNKEL
ncbi:MAG: hypothetical protein ABIH85_02335 [Candidatus Omnitrophota bacterium]